MVIYFNLLIGNSLFTPENGGHWFQNDLSAHDKEYIYIKTMAKKILKKQ